MVSEPPNRPGRDATLAIDGLLRRLPRPHEPQRPPLRLVIRTSLTVTCLAVGSALAQSQNPNTDPQDPPGQQPKPAQAAELPEQVFVSAEKWNGPAAQDMPRSFTPISERLRKDAGITSIEEAARFVPNALVTGFTARRLSFPYVRGVGSGQGDPAVATFVDDVPQLSISSTNLSLVGLDRIEILRGPSGALWGRNTIGGAINLITKEPEFQNGAELFASVGNFNSQRYEVRATGPITEDSLAASVSASYERRDGFTDNTFTGNDVDFRESTFARGQVLWAPDDDNTVRFVLYGEGTRDGGFVLSDVGGLRSNPYRINQDFEGSTDRDILAASVIWEHTGDGFDFTSITSAQTWEIDETSDFDFSQIDGVRRYTSEEEDYAYQEFRLQSNGDYDPSDRDATGMRWLAGVSGFYSDERRSAANEFRPGGAGIIFAPSMVGTDRSVGDFQSYALSAFGQVSMLLGSGLEVSGAVRYDYEDKKAGINRTFSVSGFTSPLATTSQSRSFDRVLPRASITWRANDDVTSYFTIARGFKAGGFNLTAPSGQESFGVESSWTYELGVKSRWLDDRVQANAAVFFVDWDDMQLSQFDPMAGGFVSNAGESTSQGIELELVGEATDELTVFGTAGYLDTEFDRFTDQFGQDVSGRSLPFAPEWTFGAGAQYRQRIDDDLAAFARIDYFHVGEFYYDAGNLGRERYNLTNLRIGVDYENWRVDLFMHNAFDEEYVSLAFQANPADPTQFVGQNGAPRTYGLSVRVTF
jgi:iron complex outermembrane receptor protein